MCRVSKAIASVEVGDKVWQCENNCNSGCGGSEICGWGTVTSKTYDPRDDLVELEVRSGQVLKAIIRMSGDLPVTVDAPHCVGAL